MPSHQRIAESEAHLGFQVSGIKRGNDERGKGFSQHSAKDGNGHCTSHIGSASGCDQHGNQCGKCCDRGHYARANAFESGVVDRVANVLDAADLTSL